MNITERTVSGGRTAILLVPEISLTPHMLKNLRGRFGESVAILHSGLSDGERHDEWLRLKRGEARIVVGARSAIFAPLNNIGVIIMDEEHEQSYISESNPRYDTKVVSEMARRLSPCQADSRQRDTVYRHIHRRPGRQISTH